MKTISNTNLRQEVCRAFGISGLGKNKKRPGFYMGVSGQLVQSYGTWNGTETVNANCTFNEILRKVVFVLKHLYEQI